MSVTLRPSTTRAQSLEWAGTQDWRYEFNGEYHAVASILHYVVVEQASPVLVRFSRRSDEPWTATPLSTGDTLALPELGLEIPVATFFEDVTFEGV